MQALQDHLGYTFADPTLLEAALTHRSFRHEHVHTHHDNQRLEFLGDAALGLVAATYLFERFPQEQEGPLTRYRSQIADRRALAIMARRIGLAERLRLGRGELLSGGGERDSNLADAMEAVLGAIYLDGGLEAVATCFTALFAPLFEELRENDLLPNPKGSLLELTQARWKSTPVYQVVETVGPHHDRRFQVEVLVEGDLHGTGTGRTKREAEALAAREALEHLEGEPPS